ncbi:allantoicase [Kickxella alabastrina]|uniref:allantoicase n=1 Tax=Kickxella alabastrina TaxID=61397 RepID=UPI00221F74F9|nr:allantoicase [Kickxella alabastrina]KAI7834167.1 allantoicase [Kickxella alabastrina]
MSAVPAFRSVQADSAEVAALKSKSNLVSVSLGSKIISFSDEFFAEASNLLKDEEAVFLPDVFTERGKLMDGWETRRHNKKYDWTIVQLGYPGSIFGFDVDTSHFTGNHAPVVSIEGANCSEDEVISGKAQFEEILARVDMNPSSHHYFVYTAPTKVYTHLRVNNYPDGGIARLRVYGQVVPQALVVSSDGLVDLAFVGNGGRAVACSNQHYSSPSNLVLPGRGKTMGDGWETRRSRTPNHSDWVVLKLGIPGVVRNVEFDTRQFCGNFPPLVTLHGTVSEEDTPADDARWLEIIGGVPLTADKQHYFEAEKHHGVAFTHVKFTMYPDGGIKRIRINGRPAVSA